MNTAKYIIAAVFAVYSVLNVTAGDVNGDGRISKEDLFLFSDWMLGKINETDTNTADISGDGILDISDYCLMKEMLISQLNDSVSRIFVHDTEELKTALSEASAGDEIILAPGEYVYSGATPKGHMFTCEAEGTEERPVILRSEDPEDPAVLSGTDVNENYCLTVTGDWWEIRDLVITNAGKGIIVDNSLHTKIINCEVYGIGAEGIHFRDNSSYCIAENCFVHDTGIVSPAYGEAIYIGSSKSTQGYGYDCNYNTVRGCRLGPGVAAEHVDVKEYTTGTLIENCIFDGTGISGENSANSFVDLKGNDCILRNNTGYRNGCEKVERAFDMNCLAEGWGQNALIYGNKVYMDQSLASNGKKMYLLNAWNCSATVWDNYMAYEDGELFTVDDEADHWKYYNCNMLTYGESSEQ